VFDVFPWLNYWYPLQEQSRDMVVVVVCEVVKFLNDKDVNYPR